MSEEGGQQGNVNSAVFYAAILNSTPPRDSTPLRPKKMVQFRLSVRPSVRPSVSSAPNFDQTDGDIASEVGGGIGSAHEIFNVEWDICKNILSSYNRGGEEGESERKRGCAIVSVSSRVLKDGLA